MAWDFSTEPEFDVKLDWMRSFVRNEIMPLETLAEQWRSDEGRATFKRITDPMKEEVKAQGLWAAHLPPEMGGGGFGQVKLGLMHEILGQCLYAPVDLRQPGSRLGQRRAASPSAGRPSRRSSGCSRCSTASSARASR